MESIVNLVKSSGNAVYNFFHFLATLVFILGLTFISTPYPQHHGAALMVVFGTCCYNFMTGRVIQSIILFFVFAFYINKVLIPGV